jgi:hypothetical protein
MTLEDALDIVVAATGHTDYRWLCDESHPSHVEYRRLVLELAERPIAAPPPTSTSSALLDIPLAGDVVESIARRIGADRLAAWWAAKTGRPCGCADRQAAMNRATRTLLKWAGLDR